MKETINYLKKLLKDGDTVIIALSGGPDSMCLLHMLKSLDKKISMICAHVNHQTRKNNEKEAKFIKEYLEKEHIPLEYYKIESYKNNRFSEAEARNKRYAFFKEIAEKYGATYLFTAHHGDDLVETILMRILRGSTLTGYSGIKKESEWDGLKMIRPLLSTTKKEIIHYLEENQVPYVLDESNDNDEYLRNRIRHSVLPLLEAEDPKFQLKFLKFSQKLTQASDLIQSITKSNLEKIKENDKIKKQPFSELDSTLQEYVLKEYLKEIYQEDLGVIEDKHVRLAKEYILENNRSSSIDFPLGWHLYKTKENFWLAKQEIKKDYCIKCERNTMLPNGELKEESEYQEKSNFEIHLNSKDVTLPLYITTRKNGMKMAVKNLNGHKKVNDILIDKKVPKHLRDEVPIMIDQSGKVLWILGISKSKYDLAKNENYDIIYKYIKRKE